MTAQMVTISQGRYAGQMGELAPASQTTKPGNLVVRIPGVGRVSVPATWIVR